MGRELVEAVQVVGADAPVEAGAEALGGVGGVLGDVAGYLLGRQLPRLVVTGRDVADVELLTPPRIAVRLAIEGRTMHPDRRNCQPQRLLKAGPAGGRQHYSRRREQTHDSVLNGGSWVTDGLRPMSMRAASAEISLVVVDTGMSMTEYRCTNGLSEATRR
jgi:hypothetical protein